MGKSILLLTVVIGMVVSSMAQPIEADKEQLAKKVRYPDYDEQGRLNFEIMGDEAKIQPDGVIQIKNLKMIFYDEGKVMMQVDSPWCLFDRVKRTAASTSEVCIARAEIVLTGKGFEWRVDDEQLKIHNDAKLLMRKITEQSSQENSP